MSEGQLLKSFLDGLFKKAGEALWVWLAPLLYAALVPVCIWFGSPKQLSASLSRLDILGLGLLVVVLSVVAYLAGIFVAKHRYEIRTPTIDQLQRKVLCSLWSQQQNTVAFKDMLKVTGTHPSDLILAGERLQQHGLIAFSALGPDSLMQLQKEGREYIKANGLDAMTESTLADRILRLDN